MDEAGALAGLARTEQKLHAYAAKRGLTVRPELTWPGQPLPDRQRGPVRFACWSVSGGLPGGTSGRLRHQAVYGKTFGVEVAGQHTIMICRIPESVGYLPLLSVRAEGLEPGLFYWAGDRRPREDVGGFESIELDRRYIVEVAKGQDHGWLRQLFPPSFIDWLAADTPVDFGFRLDRGVFTCECPQYRGQHRAGGEVDEEHLDLLAGAGGRAASRIRDEVLEEAETTPAGTDSDSADGQRAPAGGRRHGRLLGLLIKLAGGAGDQSVAKFGAEHGMEPKDPAEFHANHIRVPLPGTASDVLTGPLPGSGRPGDLAWLEFSSAVDMQRNYNAIVIQRDRELPSLWVDADDVTVPGFGGELSPDGLAAARAAGYGISTAGRKACVYMSSSQGAGSWPGGDELARFCARAAEVANAV